MNRWAATMKMRFRSTLSRVIKYFINHIIIPQRPRMTTFISVNEFGNPSGRVEVFARTMWRMRDILWGIGVGSNRNSTSE